MELVSPAVSETSVYANGLKHLISFSIIAETSTGCLLGGSALGKRELKAEEVGRKAADELLQSINTRACVDSYAQDQVTVKPFRWKDTKHLFQMLRVVISSLRISRCKFLYPFHIVQAHLLLKFSNHFLVTWKLTFPSPPNCAQ